MLEQFNEIVSKAALYNNYPAISMGLTPRISTCRVAGSGAAVTSTATCIGALSTGWVEQAAASVVKVSSSSAQDSGTTSIGTITQVTGAAKASGYIAFTVNPDPSDTITMYGQVFTFVASGATTNEIDIGTDLPTTLANAVIVLNASVVANVAKATYSTNATTRIIATFDNYGTSGNSYTLAASVATVSAATLLGGLNGVGSIAFSANVFVGDVLTINGTAFIIVASGATGPQIDVGATLSDSIDNMVTVLNASIVAGVALATYSKTGTNTTLTATYDDSALSGSTFTLAASFSSGGGTGARTVKVSGVDANYVKIQETVTLNGQTSVNTAATFRFVEELEVLTAGTGLANAGTIYAGDGTVTSGVPATKYCAVSIATNLSSQAFYVVPAGYKFVLENYDAQCGLKEVLGSATIYRKTYGGLWTSRLNGQLGYGSFAVKIKYEAYPEKTIIRLVGYSAATTQVISAALQGYLIEV